MEAESCLPISKDSALGH